MQVARSWEEAEDWRPQALTTCHGGSFKIRETCLNYFQSLSLVYTNSPPAVASIQRSFLSTTIVLLLGNAQR